MLSTIIPAPPLSFFLNLIHLPDRFKEFPLHRRRFIQAFLQVLLIFSVRFFQCLIMADFPGMRENIPSTLDTPGSLLLNCCKICNGCLGTEFPCLESVCPFLSYIHPFSIPLEYHPNHSSSITFKR